MPDHDLLAIGADGARGGWLAAMAYGSDDDVQAVELTLCPTFADLVALRTDEVPVAVDIPMGLPEHVTSRACDQQARKLLGARSVTLFTPPSRALLDLATFDDVRAHVAELRKTEPEARGLTIQAFGIAPKMREVDQFLTATPDAQSWLYECHPELSFRALAEGKVLPDKRSITGHAQRLRLLTARFPGVLDALAGSSHGAKAADTTDALDALVALDTALHVRAGDYEELGGELDDSGLVMRMVF
jgi:predicted RNase H-like nuclease